MILLMDTCGATGSVALADSSGVIASAILPGRTASERLVPTVRDLVAATGLGLHALDAVAVVIGPGSFTGVRVGLSAAKGLCEALDRPLIAISRLAILARLAHAPAGTTVHALLDAGRGEFYFGQYRGEICQREALVTRDELLAAIECAHPPHMLVACEPALTARLLAEPTGSDALPLALHHIQQQHFADPLTLDANYLRRTDAQIFAKPRSPATVASQPLRDNR